MLWASSAQWVIRTSVSLARLRLTFYDFPMAVETGRIAYLIHIYIYIYIKTRYILGLPKSKSKIIPPQKRHQTDRAALFWSFSNPWQRVEVPGLDPRSGKLCSVQLQPSDIWLKHSDGREVEKLLGEKCEGKRRKRSTALIFSLFGCMLFLVSELSVAQCSFFIIFQFTKGLGLCHTVKTSDMGWTSHWGETTRKRTLAWGKHIHEYPTLGLAGRWFDLHTTGPASTRCWVSWWFHDGWIGGSTVVPHWWMLHRAISSWPLRSCFRDFQMTQCKPPYSDRVLYFGLFQTHPEIKIRRKMEAIHNLRLSMVFRLFDLFAWCPNLFWFGVSLRVFPWPGRPAKIQKEPSTAGEGETADSQAVVGPPKKQGMTCETCQTTEELPEVSSFNIHFLYSTNISSLFYSFIKTNR